MIFGWLHLQQLDREAVMNLRRIIWMVLGVAGALELMLIASGYNALFQSKDLGYDLGSNGPMAIQFIGHMYPTIAWLVNAALIVVILVATSIRFYQAAWVAGLGAFFVGALFESILPYEQNRIWIVICSAAAILIIGRYIIDQADDFFKKKARTQAQP